MQKKHIFKYLSNMYRKSAIQKLNKVIKQLALHRLIVIKVI